MVACPAPATVRCVGWDAQRGRTLCGTGYMPGSPQCSACDFGYFETGGECERCPSGNIIVGVVVPMLALAACGAAVFAAMVTVAFCAMRRNKDLANPRRAAVVHSAQFTVWTAVTLQTLVREPSPKLLHDRVSWPATVLCPLLARDVARCKLGKLPRGCLRTWPTRIACSPSSS